MIAAGTKLGPYEIAGPIGSGGMGDVYRARDTRLNRTVALKVLPRYLAERADSLERFEREAKAIAALNHPHICVLHDVGVHDGTHFLVMEYLEGETLAARLSRGALPLPRALQYAMEIADALDKAHRQGITHRDLKPGNVMLTKSGAKLLDFGLAKMGIQSAGSSKDADVTAKSIAADLTGEGTIIGTLQYMAPEQIEGEEADARTDVFAFGAMLYEMVTGKKAFHGKSQASLIGSIMEHNPPPVSTIEPTNPPAIDHLISRCLAKDPNERWTSIQDVQFELKWIAQDIGQSRPAAIAPSGRKWTLAFGVVAILLAAALITELLRTPSAKREPVQFLIEAPAKTSFTVRQAPAVSPDGRLIVFRASESGKTALWIRSLDSSEAKPLANTDGGSQPFWSPDGRSIAFFANGKLKTMPVNGGTPKVLADAINARGGSWGPDGTIIYAPDQFTVLMKVPADGGKAEAITSLGSQERSHRWPQFLPDGHHYLLFDLAVGDGTSQVTVGNLGSNERQSVFANGHTALYASGQLLYVRSGKLLAQHFDLKTFKVAGDERTIEAIDDLPNTSDPVFSASGNGAVAYMGPDVTAPLTEIDWVDRSGRTIETPGSPDRYVAVVLSPDGKRAAFGRVDQESGDIDLWDMELSSGVRSRLTFAPLEDDDPVWSPDGKQIVFYTERDGLGSLYWTNSQGAPNNELLLKSQQVAQLPTDWSPDGRYVLFYANANAGDLWALPMSGDRKPIPVRQTPFNEQSGHFSPDGQWVAYMSNESGQFEVYVQRFPSGEDRRQVSHSGGRWPRWPRDGKELFFIATEVNSNAMFAAPVKLGTSIELGTPQRLFSIDSTDYDVSRDGQRFLINSTTKDRKPPRIGVILDWTAARP